MFVDGLHTDEQIFKDFMVVLPYISDSAIFVFHDVLNWNLLRGWKKIVNVASQEGFKQKILRRTRSGMAVLYRNVSDEVEANIEAFYQNPGLVGPP